MNTEELMNGYTQYVSTLRVSRMTKQRFLATAKYRLLPALTPSQIIEMDVYDIAELINKGLGNSTTTIQHCRYYIKEFKHYLTGVCAA